MEITFISAFFVGLFSTVHCLGMCGGIIGALTFSLPEHIRSNRWRLIPYVSAYNIGRITSYSLAGALAGGLGGNIIGLLPTYGHLILQLTASILMIGIGLYLAGWFPTFVRIEHIGKPIWKKLEPISQKLIPVKSPGHAYLFGLVWGWLPCGLVYTALIWSATASSAKDGALLMLAFGAGTLPAVMIAGILTGWFTRLIRTSYIRPIIGLIIIIMALITGYLALLHSTHQPLSENNVNNDHQHHIKN
ncbi:MAG: sulfite exporter TauE/SafE family protein [Gammaproteobacteria bacterium]|nr:sulfite exporter TauE/SafE family protein [Gammaproteobacteria bacterium]